MGGCVNSCMKYAPHADLGFDMPKGVGRIDHSSLAEKVRNHSIDLMVKAFVGSAGSSSSGWLDWVLGNQMVGNFTDPVKLNLARVLAEIFWQDTVEDFGGFALGVKNEQTGMLAGIALLIPRRGPSFGVESFVKGCFVRAQVGTSGRGDWSSIANGTRQRLRLVQAACTSGCTYVKGQHLQLVCFCCDPDYPGPERRSIAELLLNTCTRLADAKHFVMSATGESLASIRFLEDFGFELVEHSKLSHRQIECDHCIAVRRPRHEEGSLLASLGRDEDRKLEKSTKKDSRRALSLSVSGRVLLVVGRRRRSSSSRSQSHTTSLLSAGPA